MAYKQNNSPLKQSPWVNPVTGIPYSTIIGVSNRRVGNMANNTTNAPINTPKPTPVDRARDVRAVRNEIRTENTQQPVDTQGVGSLVKASYNNINNNTNSMSYDNTTGPRPLAPINPRAFSSIDTIQQVFGGTYGKTPLAQINMDPITGQSMDPSYGQTINPLMPPQVPLGVQQPITPYYDLSNQ